MNKRAQKTTKLQNQAPVPIQLINNYEEHVNLEDHVVQGNQPNNNQLQGGSGQINEAHHDVWATNVYIGDCTIVKGYNNYRYVVWTVTIETVAGAKITIYKRYSDFVRLRELLLRYFPKNKVEIGQLPPKRYLQNNLDESFLRKRRTGLEYFLNSIMLNPRFSSSPLVKEFVLKG